MQLSFILLNRVVIMLIFILIGAAAFKTKLVTEEGNKSLSNLVLYVINPALIFISFQQDFSMRLLKGLGWSILLTTAGFIICIVIAHFLFRGENAGAEKFMAVYPNCGFMGIPLASVMFGAEGVFYITAFNAVFNTLAWTHGVLLVSGQRKNIEPKKILQNPTMIATALGILLFVLHIRVPDLLYDTIDDISVTIAPMAMFVAGVTIAQADMRHALKKGKLYLVTLLKLFGFPLLIALLFSWIPDLNRTVALTTILAFACPAATMGIMLSLRFDQDPDYAAELFAVSTLLSVLSMPAVIFLESLM